MAETLLSLVRLAFVELALFAAVGFIIGGIDELAIDLIWLIRGGWRRLTIYRRNPRVCATDLPLPAKSFRLAVFVPAWDEADVIAPMLRTALNAYREVGVTIFVGCYPNDQATIVAARSVQSDQIRVVIGNEAGPTTKAGCLNTLWRALVAERGGDHGYHAVCLHDAEDVISPYEARVAAHLLPNFGLLQLPVVPLVHESGRWISGHYCDEFAESHSKTLIVREALGAALPLAGVGCILRADVLARLAANSDAGPFDADSLTEDYETGLKLGATGCRSAFIRMSETPGGRLVGTYAYFPATFKEAVRQKARWLLGIGISGWERMGWGRGWVERWTRVRDRQGLLAALVLCAGYGAFALGSLLLIVQAAGGPRVDVPPFVAVLLQTTLAVLLWRLLMRAYFVGRIYGLAEALRSVPRTILSNVISIFAACRAVTRYTAMAKQGRLEWDKTAHRFPDGAI